MKHLKVLALALLVGCEGCAYTATTYLDPTAVKIYVVKIPQDPSEPKYGSMGQTTCDTVTNRPVVLLDSAFAFTDSTRYLLIHEYRHAIQLATYYKGGCEEGRDRYNKSPTLRLQWEMEAECAAMSAQPYDKERFQRRVALYYERKKFPKHTLLELEQKFAKVCAQERMKRKP